VIHEPNRNELMAMYLWGDKYAKQNLSVIDWYKTLNDTQRAIASDCIRQLIQSKP
jgi:hypothetical protein